MMTEARGLGALRTIADYQFGAGAGQGLFHPDGDIEIRRSKSGRPRQVIGPTGRLVTLGGDGRFTLGFAGGRRLAETLGAPAYRVAVDDESEPFVRAGEDAFAKFVTDVDPVIRPYDEVLVVDEARTELLGVGRAELSADGMCDFERGVAVAMREGREEWEGR